MASPTLSARFSSQGIASEAVDDLVAAGIPAASIHLRERAARGNEGRFLGRIIVLIVLWSIPGGAVGAGLGLVLAVVGLGPGGTTGTVVQVVSWLIIGHLLAGMWAGYVLLADRSHREMAPDRSPEFVVSVACRNKAEAEAAERILGTKSR